VTPPGRRGRADGVEGDRRTPGRRRLTGVHGEYGWSHPPEGLRRVTLKIHEGMSQYLRHDVFLSEKKQTCSLFVRLDRDAPYCSTGVAIGPNGTASSLYEQLVRGARRIRYLTPIVCSP